MEIICSNFHGGNKISKNRSPVGDDTEAFFRVRTVHRPRNPMIRIRAGKKILGMIREEGLRPERISAFVGPASGPRWTVTAGLDLALADSGFLESTRRVLLIGGSAGAWRTASLARKNSVEGIKRFWDVYLNMNFTRDQNPQERADIVVDAVKGMVPTDEIPGLLDHPHFDLCFDTVRASSFMTSFKGGADAAVFAAAALANMIHPRARSLFFSPVRFYAGKGPFPAPSFGGCLSPLTYKNIRPVLAASGLVPIVLKGMKSIPGAPPGKYYDGGLEQYILNGNYSRDEQDVTLLVYHGGPVIPSWLDKNLVSIKNRLPSLDNVLLVYPSTRFIERLPYSRIPDRDDWKRFKHNPAERIRMWRTVISSSMELGYQFMDFVQGNGMRKAVKPIDVKEGSRQGPAKFK